MTSKTTPPKEVFVWIWLPGETEPVVVGRIERDGERYIFNYGQSYLQRDGAIPIYVPELPLKEGVIEPLPNLYMAGALRDGLPDAWGRRVIINKLTGLKGEQARDIEFDELTYMLQSGTDRVGALDFQASSSDYVARSDSNATLEELLASAERVEKGIPLTPELDQALHHGSSIGGARPKALIEDGSLKYIAKFSATNDTYAVVKAEFIAMRLAALVGLDVAPVKLETVSGKDVLLVERFDRKKVSGGWARRGMVSALTLFELDEMMPRYASYEKLAEIIRFRFADHASALRELFGRLTFNILVSNIDDHARNHAAFWDGAKLNLTPAYDICPQSRTGYEATQAMRILGERKESRLSLCLEAAHHYNLSPETAVDIIRHQIITIRDQWKPVCEEAHITEVDQRFIWRRQFLNAAVIEGCVNQFGDLLDWETLT